MAHFWTIQTWEFIFMIFRGVFSLNWCLNGVSHFSSIVRLVIKIDSLLVHFCKFSVYCIFLFVFMYEKWKKVTSRIKPMTCNTWCYFINYNATTMSIKGEIQNSYQSLRLTSLSFCHIVIFGKYRGFFLSIIDLLFLIRNWKIDHIIGSW